MIRYILISLAAIFLILILLYLGANSFFNRPCQPPIKPSIVPKKAMWFGGCDGGYWILLSDIKDGKYRFKIYRDWDGVLEFDADFIYKDSDCTGIGMSKKNWANYVLSYRSGLDSLEYIDLKMEAQGKHCCLKCLYPAYGGENWDIIKEKYHIK